MDTFWARILDQKSKKKHPKRHTKFNPEKVLKFYEKSSQNDAKIDAKMNDFPNFFKKEEKYEIKLPLEREHDCTGLGHLKMYEKSIQTTYKFHVRKSVAKSMEMMPKWSPNGGRDRLKI